MKSSLFYLSLGLLLFFTACQKHAADTQPQDPYAYYELTSNNNESDWRDVSFIVRTKDPQLIQQMDAQLTIPLQERKAVCGRLVRGSGGYNKNGTHEFLWHFQEDDWVLTDITVEIYDGRPYSDVDSHLDEWVDHVKRFCPWGHRVSRRLR